MRLLLKRNAIGVTLLLSLCLLYSLSFTHAQIDTSEVTDVFQVNELIQYNKPCINNGTYCSGSAACNYTFYDRGDTIISNNVAATSVGANGASIWQYNFSRTDTGLYKADMCCTDGSERGCATLYYQVSGDGRNNSIGFYLLIIGISFGIIIFGFVIKDGWVAILGTFGLYFVALYILFFGIAGTKDAVTTWGIGLILLSVATYLSVRAAIEMIDNDN